MQGRERRVSQLTTSSQNNLKFIGQLSVQNANIPVQSFLLYHKEGRTNLLPESKVLEKSQNKITIKNQ